MVLFIVNAWTMSWVFGVYWRFITQEFPRQTSNGFGFGFLISYYLDFFFEEATFWKVWPDLIANLFIFWTSRTWITFFIADPEYPRYWGGFLVMWTDLLLPDGCDINCCLRMYFFPSPPFHIMSFGMFEWSSHSSI